MMSLKKSHYYSRVLHGIDLYYSKDTAGAKYQMNEKQKMKLKATPRQVKLHNFPTLSLVFFY